MAEISFVITQRTSKLFLNSMNLWKRPFLLDELYKLYPPQVADTFSADDVFRLKHKLNKPEVPEHQREMMRALYERLEWAEEYAGWQAHGTFSMNAWLFGAMLSSCGSLVAIPAFAVLYFFTGRPINLILAFATPLICWAVIYLLGSRFIGPWYKHLSDRFAQPIRSLRLPARLQAIESLREQSHKVGADLTVADESTPSAQLGVGWSFWHGFWAHWGEWFAKKTPRLILVTLILLIVFAVVFALVIAVIFSSSH